jgi:hypothetical protein
VQVILMKIERISDNIIKVTISLNDLEERNIDLEAFADNSPAAQELFWDMMEQAELEFGFNISDSQFIIEPIPDSEGGFILTITRIDDDEDFESIHKYIKNRFRRADIRVKKKTRKVFIQRNKPYKPRNPGDKYPKDWVYELPEGEYCPLHGAPAFEENAEDISEIPDLNQDNENGNNNGNDWSNDNNIPKNTQPEDLED